MYIDDTRQVAGAALSGAGGALRRSSFTAYPLVQMIWMSFHNWSLIEPAKWVGLANFVRAYNDRQFWTSLGFTLKYTLYITPILMIGGYLIALLVARNTPLRRFTRAVVFVPVVIGLGVSSLLWYWLFSYDFGLVNRCWSTSASSPSRSSGSARTPTARSGR